MAIIGLSFGIFWLAVGCYFTSKVLRWYLGSVHKEGQNKRDPFQYSMTDLYALTLQIALFAMPLMQLRIPIDERAGLLVALTLYLVFSWLLCCRALSRVKIRKAKPRIAAILVFPFQLTIACVFGFGWLHWILSLFFIIPAIGGLLFALVSLSISRAFSHWLMNYSEMEKGTTLAASTEAAGKDFVSESQINDAPDKILPPPDAFPRG